MNDIGPGGSGADERSGLPVDWTATRLVDVLEEVDVRASEIPDGLNVPVLSLTKNLGLIPQSERFTHRVAREDVSDYKVVRNRWLVYNPYVIWEGAIHILEEREAGLVSPVYPTWTIKDAYAPYVALVVRTPEILDAFSRLSSGVVQRRRSIKKSAFLDVKIPLPPYEEQVAIADALATLRASMRATDAVVVATEALRESLLETVLTYGPTRLSEHDAVAVRESDIGAVPKAWSVELLRAVISEGPQNGLYKPESHYGDGMRILRIDDFANEGEVVTSAAQRVRLTEQEIAKYGLRPNDLVVNRVNSLSHLGKTALVGELQEPLVFESNMMRFSVDADRVEHRYVFHVLRSPRVRRQIKGKAKRAIAQSSINQGDVTSTLIPLPPVEDQRAISDLLDAFDAKLRAESLRRESLDTLLDRLQRELLAGRLRLDPRDNDHE